MTDQDCEQARYWWMRVCPEKAKSQWSIWELLAAYHIWVRDSVSTGATWTQIPVRDR